MFKDRVYEQSTSTGTGSFTLGGAATGYRTFSATFTASTDAYYLIVNRAVPTEWEVGKFTVSGTSLARIAGNVYSSSAGAGTLVNFSAGTKDVFNSIPAVAMAGIDSNTLLTTARQSVYQDVTVANCAGIIANGNCSSNPNWAMPNGNWWTWGITGVTRANPSGYDFAGGTTTVNTALTTLNTKILGTYTLYQAQVGYDVYQRTSKNCNCGAFNCYSNCNCNCNCNCDCNCTCNGCSCFPAGTKVLMASGDWKKIEELASGDELRGLAGETNRVTAMWKPQLGAHRALYEINGEFRTTGDHLLWTEQGWGAIAPALYRVFRYESLLFCEDAALFIQGVIDPDKVPAITTGTRMLSVDGTVRPVERVSVVDAAADTQLYCPILDGNQSFVIQGGYVADGVIGERIPAQVASAQNLTLREELGLARPSV